MTVSTEQMKWAKKSLYVFGITKPTIEMDSIESSSVGRHIHCAFGPVSQGKKNWGYKYLSVLEMSSDDINETIYLVLFADKPNTRYGQLLESWEGPVAGGGASTFVGGGWDKSECRLPLSPARLHNWTLPPCKHPSLINQQG